MQSLINSIGSGFQAIIDFFQNVWGYISTFFSFLWDLIEGLYYGFNTIISHLWENFQAITGLSFISDNSFVFSYLASFLGISASSLFTGLFLIIIFLVILRFIFSLIPFFKK